MTDEEIEIELSALRADIDELRKQIEEINASLEHLWGLEQHQ